MKKCPKCGNKTFIVGAHVVQLWKVDENGEYIQTVEECDCVAHHPDNEDMWQCAECGYEDSGDKFEEEN